MRNYLNRFNQFLSFLFLVFIHTSAVSCNCGSKGLTDDDTTSNSSSTSTFSSTTRTFSSTTRTFSSTIRTSVSDPGSITITDGMLEATGLYPGLKKLLEDIKENEGKAVDLNQKIDPQIPGRTPNQPVGLVIELLTNYGGINDPAKIATYKPDLLKVMHKLIDRGAELTRPKFVYDRFNILFQLINLRRPDLIDELIQYKDKLPKDKYNGKTVLEYAKNKETTAYNDQERVSYAKIVKSLEDAGIN